MNIALGVEGGCANLRCFCESVLRLLVRTVGIMEYYELRALHNAVCFRSFVW